MIVTKGSLFKKAVDAANAEKNNTVYLFAIKREEICSPNNKIINPTEDRWKEIANKEKIKGLNIFPSLTNAMYAELIAITAKDCLRVLSEEKKAVENNMNMKNDKK